MRLRMGYKLNVTRISRAGMDLLPSSNLRLQIGDRLTVVGKRKTSTVWPIAWVTL